MASVIVELDPRSLHLPPSRLSGVDPYKLNRQITLYGQSVVGMPDPGSIEGRTAISRFTTV